MLVLFETPAGFALFKVLDEGKLSKVEDLSKEFATADSARKVVKLKAFSKFENTSEALEAATKIIEGTASKGLRKFLRGHCDGEILAVADSKLGNAIKEKLKIDCVHSNAVMELMRGVRSQLTELISGLGAQDLAPMSLGLSHSLSRYKLKFSPDKVLSLNHCFVIAMVKYHNFFPVVISSLCWQQCVNCKLQVLHSLQKFITESCEANLLDISLIVVTLYIICIFLTCYHCKLQVFTCI
ncbi:probable nucleolar protein 5-2 [Mercurialis annua]|uniref:probable nucleolar protein 5-2 n=1 Tax=Mercurialis annua TaxID=3986 RepID=UPI00216058DD|nr:probable nucleolar protein 5-2 [Mercurialis annua]XP_050220893.1 probable nucleolar protein 5-2 [Mercurialis annua]XP_050220894.1 probable nucleolar protein 5-2 [Mercurialis annua]